MIHQFNHIKNSSGFTLVEILVTSVLLVIVFTFGILFFQYLDDLPLTNLPRAQEEMMNQMDSLLTYSQDFGELNDTLKFDQNYKIIREINDQHSMLTKIEVKLVRQHSDSILVELSTFRTKNTKIYKY